MLFSLFFSFATDMTMIGQSQVLHNVTCMSLPGPCIADCVVARTFLPTVTHTGPCLALFLGYQMNPNCCPASI